MIQRPFLIWSWEHHAWWRPDHMGYTTDLQLAGLYTVEEAGDIVLGHIPPGEEVAVHEAWAQRNGRPPVYTEDQR